MANTNPATKLTAASIGQHVTWMGYNDHGVQHSTIQMVRRGIFTLHTLIHGEVFTSWIPKAELVARVKLASEIEGGR